MTRTIKKVLANLTEHTEVSRYAVETGLKTPSENYENIQRKINHALSEIEKIMDGVIGEDLPPEQPFDEEMEQIELLGNRLFRKGANWSKANQRQSLKEVLGE